MDLIEKHRITLLNAKCQVVCMAENLMKKMQHGDNIDCCVKKLFAATRLINRLDCYCFPTTAQNIPGEETLTIFGGQLFSGTFTLTSSVNGITETISTYTTPDDGEQEQAVSIILNNLLNQSGLVYLIQSGTEGIVTYITYTTCEIKNLSFGNEEMSLFTVVKTPVCSVDTTCNNCITDAQLNKMYQVLDSLLQ
jgi:hypothetical protein